MSLWPMTIAVLSASAAEAPQPLLSKVSEETHMNKREAHVPRVAVGVRDWVEFIVGKCVSTIAFPAQSECVDDSLCPVFWRCRVLTLAMGTILWCICRECSDGSQANSVERPNAVTDHYKMLLNL